MTRTAVLLGVDAQLIDVEVYLCQGRPSLSIIGLGDTAIEEARCRVQCALRSVGEKLPHEKCAINLTPASIRKDGATLDLPMALALLAAAGLLPVDGLAGTLAVGELALTGALRPVRGVLPIAALARERGFARLIVPQANGPEARMVEGIDVLAPAGLFDLLAHLRTGHPLPDPPLPDPDRPPPPVPDLADVRGQHAARRALEVAAAGAHNLLLIGPPGSGKTMLARRLPSILPPLTAEERVAVTRIWSAAGLLQSQQGLLTERPFRAPHYSASEAALVGGGSSIRPGEASLADRGVLFLDEMPEFPRGVLESLRQPMEDRVVTIARARHSVRLPAAFLLVGAANPCPCGWRGDPSGRCTCGPAQLKRYAGRLGALLDRIDVIVDVPAAPFDERVSSGAGEASALVRQRVLAARAHAARRGVSANAAMDTAATHVALTRAAGELARDATARLGLSALAVDRMLRVARTIADLEGSEPITEEAVAESIRYQRSALVDG